MPPIAKPTRERRPSFLRQWRKHRGLTLETVYGDSGDTDNKAYETTIPRLLGEDVSAIIGAASSLFTPEGILMAKWAGTRAKSA